MLYSTVNSLIDSDLGNTRCLVGRSIRQRVGHNGATHFTQAIFTPVDDYRSDRTMGPFSQT